MQDQLLNNTDGLEEAYRKLRQENDDLKASVFSFYEETLICARNISRSRWENERLQKELDAAVNDEWHRPSSFECHDSHPPLRGDPSIQELLQHVMDCAFEVVGAGDAAASSSTGAEGCQDSATSMRAHKNFGELLGVEPSRDLCAGFKSILEENPDFDISFVDRLLLSDHTRQDTFMSGLGEILRGTGASQDLTELNTSSGLRHASQPAPMPVSSFQCLGQPAGHMLAQSLPEGSDGCTAPQRRSSAHDSGVSSSSQGRGLAFHQSARFAEDVPGPSSSVASADLREAVRGIVQLASGQRFQPPGRSSLPQQMYPPWATDSRGYTAHDNLSQSNAHHEGSQSGMAAFHGLSPPAHCGGKATFSGLEHFPDTLSKDEGEANMKLEVRSLGAWRGGAPQEKRISAEQQASTMGHLAAPTATWPAPPPPPAARPTLARTLTTGVKGGLSSSSMTGRDAMPSSSSSNAGFPDALSALHSTMAAHQGNYRADLHDASVAGDGTGFWPELSGGTGALAAGLWQTPPKIPRGQEPLPSHVTTLVVRNVPARCSQAMLLQIWPPSLHRYNLLHLPYCHRTRCPIGKVFVNFGSHEAALAFRARWHGVTLMPGAKAKALDIGMAEVQGYRANLEDMVHNTRTSRLKNKRHMPVIIRPDGSICDFKEVVALMTSSAFSPEIAEAVESLDVADALQMSTALELAEIAENGFSHSAAARAAGTRRLVAQPRPSAEYF